MALKICAASARALIGRKRYGGGFRDGLVGIEGGGEEQEGGEAAGHVRRIVASVRSFRILTRPCDWKSEPEP
jgi:hypothetical protein